MFMVTKALLAGQRVLITLPRQQSEQLTQLIEHAGGEAIVFPVIAIKALALSDWLVPDLAQTNWLIFVSRNAVASFMAGWQHDLPEHLKFAAVGGGTAQAMRESGLTVHCQPQTSSGSDGLLTMPEMQAVAGCNILIIRGVGGRELLADTLASRGANISYLEVYRRELPTHGDAACEQALNADKVVCTSVTGVDNLSQLLSENRDELFNKPLLVVSDRIKAHAESLGFSHVAVSVDASDVAMLQTLIKMDE
jgi:uroporphyrinogen-III synthase